MTATDAKLDSLDKDLRHIARLVNDLLTSDFEAVGDILRTIQEMRGDVEEIMLDLAPDATDDLSLPEAA